MNDTGTRQYRSAAREQQARATRDRVLKAAIDLFAARGWAGTGMRDVAGSAGVSVETVYKNFSSKAELLKRVLEVTVVGDDEPVALAQRAEFLAVGAGSLLKRAHTAAALVTSINARQAPLMPALREGASSDQSLTDILDQIYSRRRQDVGRGGEMVARRPLTDAETDGLWALLSIDVYLLLTRQAGWADNDYLDWLRDTLVAIFAAPSGSGRTRVPKSRGGRK